MPHQAKSRKPAQLRELAKLIASTSEHNRAPLARAVERRFNDGASPGANVNFARAVRLADRFLGKPVEKASSDELIKLTTHFREGRAPTTGHLYSILFRCFLKDRLNIDGDDKLPADLNRASKVKKPKMAPKGQVVEDEWFHAMLEEAARLDGDGPTQQLRAMRVVALLWLYWDTGVRPGEALCLGVGDVHKEKKNGKPTGAVYVELREEAGDLKTEEAAGIIYLGHSLAPIQALLTVHPRSDDPHAPLFWAFSDTTGTVPMPYDGDGGVHAIIERLGDVSGVNAKTPNGNKITAHDFRHTGATRDSWRGEAFLRKKYRWSLQSAMPALYVSLRTDVLKEAAMRDAGIDETGFKQKMDVGDKQGALLDLLGDLLREREAAKRAH